MMDEKSTTPLPSVDDGSTSESCVVSKNSSYSGANFAAGTVTSSGTDDKTDTASGLAHFQNVLVLEARRDPRVRTSGKFTTFITVNSRVALATSFFF